MLGSDGANGLRPHALRRHDRRPRPARLAAECISGNARDIVPGLAVMFATGQIHPGVAPGDLVLNKAHDMLALTATMQTIFDRRA
ncbi:hypothetical protein PO883_31040 [Massilia sp. DJPM01]|uniref:hypothetical protein n=1 Tax=Massilia sp. DJPM01 TaxID=3024404 RepID=UPI00259FA876|nr:hypothetical protein [Massilia sp. DJPM01]MDM5181617.1 hypothetical protein [Massilia sp. DJPM01]